MKLGLFSNAKLYNFFHFSQTYVDAAGNPLSFTTSETVHEEPVHEPIELQTFVDSAGDPVNTTRSETAHAPGELPSTVHAEPFNCNIEQIQTIEQNQIQTNTEFYIQQAFQTVINHQRLFMENQRLLLQNQVNIAKDVSDVRKCMLEIYGKINQPHIDSTQPDSLDASNILSDFEKIVSRDALVSFENKMDDRKYRANLISALANAIGKNHRDMSHRNIAMLLEPKIFGAGFWSTTAWTGGKVTQDGVQKKFAFARHIIFRSFFNDAIKAVCGTPIPDSDMILLVQGKTKNCNYTRKTDRAPASRKRIRLNLIEENSQTDNSEKGIDKEP